ncbi:hypothetical protein IV203_001543 [Nitzschia inconspicua]|uniref:Uncharacterized protein n=1 Tax=Nitzschia inconspicua TaxID=303405 RepID=A0A9K3L8S3_9STRA|nr:hypothetical protein IV203_001543 [Nitzschia inconspicua]
MGTCQSQTATVEVTGGNSPRGSHANNMKSGMRIDAQASGRDPDGKLPPIAARSKVPAYELALMMSPSERTNVTQAMTPLSLSGMGECQLDDEFQSDDISELDVPFDEGSEADEDNEVPSDEEGHELEHACKDITNEGLSDSDSYLVATSSENYVFSTPGGMVTPRTSSASEGTPGTAKKTRLSLFTRSSKKSHRDTCSTGTPPGEKDLSLVEPIEDASPGIRVSVGSSVPLVAPPKGVGIEFDSSANSTRERSVNRQTLASFNKLKIQAQQAENQEQKQKQKEKIKDRRKDIQGYNELWQEYNAIQQKVSQQEQENDAVTRPEAKTVNEVPISIQDTSSWFVDFASLNGGASEEGHFVNEDEDARSHSSFSLHSERSERAQRELFKLKARKRRMSSVAAKALCCENDLDGSSVKSRLRTSVNLNDNTSTISDFSSDHGSITVLDKTDDYGVLKKFRHKSIEQSVMDYGGYFEGDMIQPQSAMTSDSALRAIHFVDPSILAEVQGHHNVYPDAPTPKTVNSRSGSIEAYLEEMSLPSVSIENAETGVVRWREFPKDKEKAKTARKLEFFEETQVKECDVISENPGSSDEALEKHNLQDNVPENPLEKLKPKIKTYHPVISSMSKEDFFRAYTARGVLYKDEISGEQVAFNLGPTTAPEVPGVCKGNDRMPVQPSIPADGGSAKTADSIGELKTNRDLLARKVGTKLAALVAQLKENGLGE